MDALGGKWYNKSGPNSMNSAVPANAIFVNAEGREMFVGTGKDVYVRSC